MPESELTPVGPGHPVHDLFLAINLYVSTGNHIGEGIAATAVDGRLLILLPINRELPRDVQDWDRFVARFSELERAFETRLEPEGGALGMEVWAFAIRPEQVLALAAALRERPGPLGWGSNREVVERVTREERG